MNVGFGKKPALAKGFLVAEPGLAKLLSAGNLIGRYVAGHYVHFRADGAKSLMPVERLVRFSVAVAEYFNLLHFLIIFFDTGKELQQPGFEYVIRKRCFGEKLSSTQT